MSHDVRTRHISDAGRSTITALEGSAYAAPVRPEERSGADRLVRGLGAVAAPTVRVSLCGARIRWTTAEA